MRRIIAIGLIGLLAACDVPLEEGNPLGREGFDPDVAAKNFRTVVQRVEPIAEAVCRRRAPRLNCDFLIVVDNRRRQPINAFQFEKEGRPVIGITVPLIAEARNVDELAFILGHEAAHHVLGHLAKTRKNALEAASIFGATAQVLGGTRSAVRQAAELGAELGARKFSKEFELEADALGTLIAKRAGFDPVRGAQYFTRTPDPGDAFLGTHPPNAARIATVRKVAAGL